MTPTPWVDDKGDGRLDHYFSSTASTCFGRYSHRLLNRTENHVIPGPSGGDANGNVRVFNQQVAGGATTTSPRPRCSISASPIRSLKAASLRSAPTAPTCLRSTEFRACRMTRRFGGGLTSQQISGFTNLGRQSSNPQFQNPTTINPKVNYSKILGRHSLKTGYEYQPSTRISSTSIRSMGRTTTAGSSRAPRERHRSNNLYNLADFLFGAQSAYSLNNQIVLNYRQRMHFGISAGRLESELASSP